MALVIRLRYTRPSAKRSPSMTSGPGRVVRLDARRRARSPSARIDSTISATDALTSIAKRSIGFGLTMLRRSSRKRLSVVQLALDRACGTCPRDSASTSSRSEQPRAVADVLNRMRQVVDQAGGDAAEHRLPFLALDVFLQLDEPVGHRVEGVAELARTRRRSLMSTRVSSWPAATACVARLQRRRSAR